MEITDKITLDNYIKTGQTILVDFYASWCGPCKILAPQLEKLTNVTLLKINGDQADATVQQQVEELMTLFDVTAFPTVIIFKEGKFVTKVVGANLAAIKAAL